MKFSVFVLTGFVLLFGVIGAKAAPAVQKIPFAILSQEFEPGDVIILEHVYASSPQLKIGDYVVVRGKYRLKSRPVAMLGFFLTTSRGRGESTPVSPTQRMDIKEGEGTFALVHVVPAEGRLHVSFYGAPKGGSFGEIYFGPAKQ